jgi:alcohol dehydrogenase
VVKETGGSRALFVTDPGIEATGHVERGLDAVRRTDIKVFVFNGVEENPTTRHVDKALAFAKANRIDSIVGFGGGSSLDTAKGVNFLISNGGKMADYWGTGKATKPMLPMIAVPTTAGTGSEAQSYALIADEKTHQKMACGDKKVACRAAILDPELTLTQPPGVTAATGIDAVAHAVESWTTTRRNAISCLFAKEAWTRLSGAFEDLASDPDNIELRSAMQIGAMFSGAAIEHSMLGGAHSCANPLTARYGIVHGAAVGLMLPHVVRFNGEICSELYAELIGPGASDPTEELANWIGDMLDAHRLPRRLFDYGVEESDIPALAADALSQWTAQFNPRALTEADFVALYQGAF